jgi:tetratricopeptide (TPR) repeat protein
LLNGTEDWFMTTRLQVLAACVLVAAIPPAWSNGGGSMPMPQISAPREESPEDKAKTAYNKGVHDVKKADKFQASSLQLTDAGKKERALHEAQEYYSSARVKFQEAVQDDPRMHEAWNYVGYTNRKLGNYDAALAAYEQALTLKPGYPDALEYRGEAFLGLNRISDAQQAYLDLFASNRGLADKLLTAMRGWLDTQRTSSTADANAISELDKWIQERSAIAGQTASLTREGTAASWK